MANKINYTGSSKILKRICETLNEIIDRGGTSDYSVLSNKPSINGVTLEGNKTSGQLNISTPIASASTLGGIKVGNGLSIADDGTLSTNGGTSITSTTGVLLASSWAGSSSPYQYNLGNTYTNKSVLVGYDASAQTASEVNRSAAAEAKITGGEGTILYAYGTKPAVDIPIVIIYG